MGGGAADCGHCRRAAAYCFQKCPLHDRGDLTCALLCAVLSGQKCSRPEKDNSNSPAAQSDKVEAASFPDASNSLVAILSHNSGNASQVG